MRDVEINNINRTYDVSMHMQDNIHKTSKVNMNMTNNIHNPEKPVMDMIVPIQQDSSLVAKIQALTSLTDVDIKHADIEQLLSLADIINDTVNQVKELSEKMPMTNNKPNIPAHRHMKMIRIEQPPRNTFIVNKLLNEVDDVAKDRAWANKKEHDKDKEDKNNYTSQNRKGTAL